MATPQSPISQPPPKGYPPLPGQPPPQQPIPTVLKPCPFCGSDAEYQDGGLKGYVRCPNVPEWNSPGFEGCCPIGPHTGLLSKEKAFAAWNARK